MPILADIEAAMAEVLPTMNRRVAHQPTGSGDLPHRRRGDRSPARLQNLLTEYQYAGKGKDRRSANTPPSKELPSPKRLNQECRKKAKNLPSAEPSFTRA